MKIAVVGTGTMGSGIAQVLAQAGHEVLLKGRSEASLAKAHKAMEKNLSRMVEKGKMEAAVKEQALSRVKDTLNYEDCAGVELVIEAIAEDMATKVTPPLSPLRKWQQPPTVLTKSLGCTSSIPCLP